MEKNCSKRPSYNFPTESKPLYYLDHKLPNMIDVRTSKCKYNGCIRRPLYNAPDETKPLYCGDHKTPDMVSILCSRCRYDKCKESATHGFKDKRPIYCHQHKEKDMVNIHLNRKCNIAECEKEYDLIVSDTKYCLEHCPDDKIEIILKRKCKYCDMEEKSDYVCKDCKEIQNKKEWAIIRHLRKTIDTKFEYDSSRMLDGCSKKRPDVYFQLDKHCVIVEIDEHQHRSYDDHCECARINEIVNGIGGKSVVIIRYNPDRISNNKKKMDISLKDRIELLVKTIKKELIQNYDTFFVKVIQLFYDDNYDTYQKIKEENITDLVCV